MSGPLVVNVTVRDHVTPRLAGLQQTLTRARRPDGIPPRVFVCVVFGVFFAGFALGTIASAWAALP